MSTELCSMEPERHASSTSAHDFVTDRGIRSLYGPRRMGRDALIRDIVSAAEDLSVTVSVYPDTSGEMVVSREEIPPIPGKDVIYTVDLCHQTVAAVRSSMDRCV